MTEGDAPKGLTRRALLKRGLFGGALLGLGGGLSWLATRGGRVPILPSEGLLSLEASGYAVLEALAERMVPAHAGSPSPSELRIALRADRALALADPSAQREVRQLLGLLESALAGFAFHGVTRPFTCLTATEQDRVLDGWRYSALTVKRTGYQALRTLVIAAYYSAPATWRALGYPGPGAGFARPGINAPPPVEGAP